MLVKLKRKENVTKLNKIPEWKIRSPRIWFSFVILMLHAFQLIIHSIKGFN